MTGLDKIIKQIEFDTQAVCSSIKARADKEVSVILKEAEIEGEKKAADIKKTSDVKCKDIIARGDSAADLEKRRTLLKTKQSVITEMLQAAKDSIKALPDDKYFNLLLEMIAKNSIDSSGEIAFSKKDLNRLPNNFEKQINSVSKGTLKIKNKPINIDGGFVLIYGGIEENCTFEAIFDAQSEKLSDEVSRLLFS